MFIIVHVAFRKKGVKIDSFGIRIDSMDCELSTTFESSIYLSDMSVLDYVLQMCIPMVGCVC